LKVEIVVEQHQEVILYQATHAKIGFRKYPPDVLPVVNLTKGKGGRNNNIFEYQTPKKELRAKTPRKGTIF